MQKTTAVLIAATLLAAAASAQMKAPPGTVKVTQGGSGSLQQIPPQPPEAAKRIEAGEALRLVKAGKAVFVDVRTRESYNAEHIQGALSIPFSEIIKRANELPPGKMIITYCA
ncbi:MAG TPA: rhodanese-like domain-containing protein [Thermoanaerobaculia bacterium]|nr:rhodanese-like domain-containing protein [Thermoanaerobaculia bacterium]